LDAYVIRLFGKAEEVKRFGKGISRKAFSKGAQVEVVGRTTVEFESDLKGAKGRPKARPTGRADYEYLQTLLWKRLFLKRFI
jgi:hypothetical protein